MTKALLSVNKVCRQVCADVSFSKGSSPPIYCLVTTTITFTHTPTQNETACLFANTHQLGNNNPHVLPPFAQDEIAFLFGSNPQPRLLDELLPGRFGPQDLSPDGPFPLLMQLRDNG